MAVDQDYHIDREYMRSRRSAFDDARAHHDELDKGTLIAGALLAVALLLLIAYIGLAAPTT